MARELRDHQPEAGTVATMVWSVLLFGVFSVIAIQGQWDNLKELLGLG
jgi:uncharacterized protein YhhL (DUF1145 family)